MTLAVRALGAPLHPDRLFRGQQVDVVMRATVISVSIRRQSIVIRRPDGVCVRIPLGQADMHDLPAPTEESA